MEKFWIDGQWSSDDITKEQLLEAFRRRASWREGYDAGLQAAKEIVLATRSVKAHQ